MGIEKIIEEPPREGEQVMNISIGGGLSSDDTMGVLSNISILRLDWIVAPRLIHQFLIKGGCYVIIGGWWVCNYRLLGLL